MIKKYLFSIFILSVTLQTNNATEPYHTPRRIEGSFSFEMIIDQKKSDENSVLQYWLLLPTDSENQKNVEIYSIYPEPHKINYNSKENSKIGNWDFYPSKTAKSYMIKFGLKADLYKVDYFLDPEMVPDEYDHDQDIVSEFTKSDSLAFITPEVIELANELTRNVTDPFLKARNIYRWILLRLDHQFPVVQRGTRFLFANPIDLQRNIYGGDSAEYCWTFVALCRAADVPARSVTGFLVKPGLELPHTWAEFYLPKWGWLPADPYLADSKELLVEFSGQSDNFFYLGHIDNYHLAFYKGSGFKLATELEYSHKPFIFKNAVWYAPIGIWNFAEFPNASANFIVTFDAFITDRYVNPEYGIELILPDLWLHQSATELGTYILKERFLTEDKLIEVNFVGRELPSPLKKIDSKQAAKLEINALKSSNSTYQIISEQPIEIGNDKAYQFIAKLKVADQVFEEYRVYNVKKNYLFWLIGSSSEQKFGKYFEKFQAIARNLKVNIPERRLR